MASKKGLLTHDEASGRSVIAHLEDGQWRAETRQDCEHIVKAASMIADQPPGKDFRHVGFIPDAVLNQWLIDGSFHDPMTVKRWLNDPDNAAFRTGKGRV